MSWQVTKLIKPEGKTAGAQDTQSAPVDKGSKQWQCHHLMRQDERHFILRYANLPSNLSTSGFEIAGDAIIVQLFLQDAQYQGTERH